VALAEIHVTGLRKRCAATLSAELPSALVLIAATVVRGSIRLLLLRASRSGVSRAFRMSKVPRSVLAGEKKSLVNLIEGTSFRPRTLKVLHTHHSHPPRV